MTTHRCPECGTETTYMMLSGGTEWYCSGCEESGEYPEDQVPRRLRMLRDGQTAALRAEMDQELARLRDVDRRNG